jgi:hypothetical protein
VPDRFDELLERIRDIRASERRMYLRLREIFAMAADYSLSRCRKPSGSSGSSRTSRTSPSPARPSPN